MVSPFEAAPTAVPIILDPEPELRVTSQAKVNLEVSKSRNKEYLTFFHRVSPYNKLSQYPYRLSR